MENLAAGCDIKYNKCPQYNGRDGESVSYKEHQIKVNLSYKMCVQQKGTSFTQMGVFQTLYPDLPTRLY